MVSIAVVGLACGPTIDIGDTEEASSSTTTVPPGTTTPGTTTPGTTTAGTTMVPPPGTTVMPPPDDTTIGVDDEWGGFDDGLFIADNPANCNLHTQDCLPGDKCMPWGDGVWSRTHCVPIVRDPDVVGDPCTLAGAPFSGLDTCDLGAICQDVDPMTGEGTCVAFCGGTEERPTCADPQTYCDAAELPLCTRWCDPLSQSCPAGEVCMPVPLDFECAPDGSGDMGAPGDPCAAPNECDPGSFCAQGLLVPGCDGMASCCTSFCDLDDPMPPCLPGQECVPWYDPGMGPAHHATVGGCMLP